MKKKGKKHLLKALLLAASLAVTAGSTPVFAAEAESSTPTPEQETPAMPETYELEIQSNKIPGWPEGPKVVARTAILMDIDTGEILYAKGIDERQAPASTTKIMTAMLAIEKVPLDTQITFTEEVWNIEKDSTHIGIQPGEILSMKDSLYGILLGSANEVSSGVAEYIGGTVPAFVDMMNQRAKDLGCENTHFVNANGLWHEDHYTSARDLAIISRAAFENETFRDIVKTPYYIIPKTNLADEERWINNHHKMITEGENFYEGCLGGKNGYTVKANNTLVTYAERNGIRLVCVVLDDVGSHYVDTRAILDYGFNNFQKTGLSVELLKDEKPESLISHLKEQGLLTMPLQNSSVLTPADSSQEITCQAAYDNNTLKFDCYYGDTLINTVSLDASQEIVDTVNAFNQPEAAPEQPAETIDDTPESAPESNPESEDSLHGFKNELLTNFKNMPNWKYAAATFLIAAFIFYIVLLVIKIKRSLKRHKKKKLRQKDKMKSDKE